MRIWLYVFGFSLISYGVMGLCFGPTASAFIGQPVAIDSRIKTFIYSPNEIFHLKFVVGYQSIIEMEESEEVVLISFGDPLPWNIKVVGRRIFIKASDPGVKTNMTIVTNKRTYLLEISSTELDDLQLDEQLVYVVRFFYPEINVDFPRLTRPKPTQLDKPLPDLDGNLPKENWKDLNLQYSYTGTGNLIAPVKVFDNGKQTFMQFSRKNAIIPSIYAVNPNGREVLLRYQLIDEYIVLDTVEYQFALRYGTELVCVFNELLLLPVNEKHARNGQAAKPNKKNGR